MTLPAAASPARPHLYLVTGETPTPTSPLPVCAGCTRPMRPAGKNESQYPGSVPEWGEQQCRSCDYLSAGKDPENRFIDVERVEYLKDQRSEYERSRRSRGVPADGLRRRNTLHVFSV